MVPVMEAARNDVKPYYADSGDRMSELPDNSRRVLMKNGARHDGVWVLVLWHPRKTIS